MTPEEHYLEAERLLALDGDARTRKEAIDTAQVHATLATVTPLVQRFAYGIGTTE